MLKYVALMRVDQPSFWSQWHSGPTARYYKSSIDTDKTVVEQWLRAELEKYPDARINERIADREYLIFTTLIAFDDAESTNVEVFLDKLIPF